MPTLNLAIAVLTRQHRAHPRSPPPPPRPRPPTAPGACPATPERRSGSPPETTSTVPSPGPSSAPPSGEDARVRTVHDAPPPSKSRAHSRSAHSTSPSRPSLPITGALTPACPTIHALWQTDGGPVGQPQGQGRRAGLPCRRHAGGGHRRRPAWHRAGPSHAAPAVFVSSSQRTRPVVATVTLDRKDL